MKTAKQTIGQRGEELASNYLVEKGYTILHQNYRYKRAEIDIIATKANFIVFVEVKTRKNALFGNPEEFVSERKQELFYEAAEHYFVENAITLHLRFDIISILKQEVAHFEDAF